MAQLAKKKNVRVRLGVHCYLTGGYVGAVKEAISLGCTTMQMFTRSPRMWGRGCKRTSPDEIYTFNELRRKNDIAPLALHAPYLPNLCSSDERIYNLSKKVLYEDYLLGLEFDADYLIIHPGGYSPGKTLADGVERISEAINYVLSEVDKYYAAGHKRLMILLETVSGGGRRIGKNFYEFKEIFSRIKYHQLVGLCIDTCHIYAAGYDITTESGVKEMLKEIELTVGLEKIKFIHLNDSRAALGSHRDIHEHIGKGYIGIAGFLNFLKYFYTYPMVLETPKNGNGNTISNNTADKNNLALVRKLLAEI
jgi:deoxyribonuclease-4